MYEFMHFDTFESQGLKIAAETGICLSVDLP